MYRADKGARATTHHPHPETSTLLIHFYLSPLLPGLHVLGYFQPSLKAPAGFSGLLARSLPRTDVLGYYQPSDPSGLKLCCRLLRDCDLADARGFSLLTAGLHANAFFRLG